MIEVNNDGFVSARELHKVLEIKTRFSNWIARMFEYGFVEKRDYLPIVQKRTTAQGNKTSYSEFLLTVKTSMEIAMIQRTTKGKEIREYLIALDERKEQGFLLSHEEILKLSSVVKAAFIKEFRDVARTKHIDTYLPVEPKGYDYANANTQRNKVCGIDKVKLEQRLAKINVKATTVEKGLIKVDKFELIRISIIDCMIHFGKSKEYAINVGDLAKKLAEERDESEFSRVNTMYSLPKSFKKTMEMLNK